MYIRKRRKRNKFKQNANVSSNKRNHETDQQSANNKPNEASSKDSHRNNETYTTVIVGDSIVKNIYGQKMGNNTNSRVFVKSFSGATTGDMGHYIKPTLERNPDHVILHVGTNDLKTTDALKVAEYR